jgi:hypothetical protein
MDALKPDNDRRSQRGRTQVDRISRQFTPTPSIHHAWRRWSPDTVVDLANLVGQLAEHGGEVDRPEPLR